MRKIMGLMRRRARTATARWQTTAMSAIPSVVEVVVASEAKPPPPAAVARAARRGPRAAVLGVVRSLLAVARVASAVQLAVPVATYLIRATKSSRRSGGSCPT